MIVGGKNRHYTAIKNIPILLHKCSNGFWTASSKDKHHELCKSSGHVKVKIPSKKKKWLKYHDNQYQFRVLFMLYADFESMLKPVDEQYIEKMTQIKTEALYSLKQHSLKKLIPKVLNTRLYTHCISQLKW